MNRILLLLAVCVAGLGAAGTGPGGRALVNAARRAHNRATGNAYREYVRQYKSQFNQTIAKKQGKCKMTPAWSINGTYPVLDEVHKGNAVYLFTMKKPCKKCWFEVRSLHRWAKYYSDIGAKAKIIVLISNKYGQYPSKVYKFAYPYLTFYNEPKGQDIFGKLKAGIYHLLMYDQCGRHQYHYKYPYSSLVKPYARMAMENVLYHYERLGCGKCLEKAKYPEPEEEDFEEFAPTERTPSDSRGPALT